MDRYSYYLNNPFLYVDFSGYTWLNNLGNWIGENWKPIVTIVATIAVVAVVTVATAGMGTLAAGAIIGAAGGFTGGALGTALNGAIFGGIAGGALGAHRGFKSAKALGNNPWTGMNKLKGTADQVKAWLGRNYKKINNKAGDDIFMSKEGSKKMRFDFNNSQGDKPHFHIEVFKNGKWRDALDTHRFYPKN